MSTTEFTDAEIEAVCEELGELDECGAYDGRAESAARLILAARRERDAANIDASHRAYLLDDIRRQRDEAGQAYEALMVNARKAATERDTARVDHSAWVNIVRQNSKLITERVAALAQLNHKQQGCDALMVVNAELNERIAALEVENAELKQALKSPWCGMCGRDLDPQELQRIAQNERLRWAFEYWEAKYHLSIRSDADSQALLNDIISVMRAALEG